MAKKSEIVIPVKRTGKVSCEFITVDFSHEKSEKSEKTQVSKSSNQQLNNDPLSNLTHFHPPIPPEIVARFFEQNPFHFRAIMLKALCVGGIGYDIVPVDSEREDYFDDPEYVKLKNFIDQPNLESEVFEDIMTSWEAERFNYGHGYLEVVTNNANELSEIYNLRAYNCFPKLHYRKLYYIQKNTGKDIWFKPLGTDYSAPEISNQKELNEILVLKNYNLRTKYFGFPEWYPATADLVLDRSVIECRIREFDNNLMIQFMIICEGGEIDSSGLRKIKQFLASNFKGVSNAGKVLYLNSDIPEVKIRIERLDKDVREVGYIRTREQNRDFILAAHGVASILLGAKVSGQLGGTTEIKDLFKIFNETIIKPEKRTFKAKINHLFKTKLGINKFLIEPKELTIDTLKEMVDYVTAMKSADIIDKNEARVEFGYEPIEEEEGNEDVVKRILKLSNEIRELRKRLAA